MHFHLHLEESQVVSLDIKNTSMHLREMPEQNLSAAIIHNS